MLAAFVTVWIDKDPESSFMTAWIGKDSKSSFVPAWIGKDPEDSFAARPQICLSCLAAAFKIRKGNRLKNKNFSTANLCRR